MFALIHGTGRSFAALRSPLDPDAIAKFGKSLNGRLFVPSDVGYEAARIPSMNPENAEIRSDRRAVCQ